MLRTACVVATVTILLLAVASCSGQDEDEIQGEPDSIRQFAPTSLTLSKERLIEIHEEQLNEVRQKFIEPALKGLRTLSFAREQAAKAAGWFAGEEAKRRIASLDGEIQKAQHALIAAQQQELQVYAKLKPLYGIVSYEFMREQRATISRALNTMNNMAYNQAWWSTIFNTRAESLTDLIVGFFLQWFLSYVLMYPFVAGYYALWASPWSIYSFSGGWGDILTAVVAWAVSTVVILLPLVALLTTGYYVVKIYGPQLQRHAEERRRQRAFVRHAALQ